MGIVEQSKNAAEVLSGADVLKARLEMARTRLRMDIVLELMNLGADCGFDNVNKIIDGLSDDVLNRELAARMPRIDSAT